MVAPMSFQTTQNPAVRRPASGPTPSRLALVPGRDTTRFGCGNPTGKKPEIDQIPTDRKLGWLTTWCLKAIQGYQRSTRHVDENGATKSMFPCPYSPSCSKYTFQAITEYGPFWGILKGSQRLFLKCNPFTVVWKLLQYRKQHGAFPESIRGVFPDPVNRPVNTNV